MTVENISWSISTKECCRPRQLDPRPPGLQSEDQGKCHYTFCKTVNKKDRLNHRRKKFQAWKHFWHPIKVKWLVPYKQKIYEHPVDGTASTCMWLSCLVALNLTVLSLIRKWLMMSIWYKSSQHRLNGLMTSVLYKSSQHWLTVIDIHFSCALYYIFGDSCYGISICEALQWVLGRVHQITLNHHW